MELSFKGKIALVTGAGAGIGEATAKVFAKAGASVVLADLHLEKVQAVADAITADGGTALALSCDVSDEQQTQKLIDTIVAKLGRLDIAFNNAGIEQEKKLLADITSDEFDRIIATDLRGVFLSMKYEIPVMLASGGGVIVNTASGAGVKGFKDQAAYTAAKHGVVGMSKSAALDYAASNIRVNVVAPGIIATPMMDRFTGGTEEGRNTVIASEPIGRMGAPEEIAAAVLYLCSEQAGFTTGAVLVADGGQTV